MQFQKVSGRKGVPASCVRIRMVWLAPRKGRPFVSIARPSTSTTSTTFPQSHYHFLPLSPFSTRPFTTLTLQAQIHPCKKKDAEPQRHCKRGKMCDEVPLHANRVQRCVLYSFLTSIFNLHSQITLPTCCLCSSASHMHCVASLFLYRACSS